MSTTLTNGLKLPDKGSVDWYADMQSNYTILDGAVGTVAEHTSQIAGKASASHTHGNITNDGKVGTAANKPLITGTGGVVQAGSFGNQANTFCEGNDSRLSDARTPVVHTHSKADITDLLNSNFIPSANNSYDLGSSSNHWNNLYAKNYYYNGTAWGLDQANVWSGDNSFTSSQLTLKNSNITRGTIPNANRNYVLSFTDSNNDNVGMIFQQVRAGSGSYKMTFSLNNGTTDHRFNFFGFTNGTSSLIPEISGVTELGSSDNKWKTFNGINPGALSLPDYNNVLDVTSEIPIASLDGNTYIDINDYLPNKTGWLSIVIADTAGNFITAIQGRAGGATAFNNSRTYHTGAQSNGFISVFFPIIAGLSKTVLIKASSLMQMRFYYCLGNV